MDPPHAGHSLEAGFRLPLFPLANADFQPGEAANRATPREAGLPPRATAEVPVVRGKLIRCSRGPPVTFGLGALPLAVARPSGSSGGGCHSPGAIRTAGLIEQQSPPGRRGTKLKMKAPVTTV